MANHDAALHPSVTPDAAAAGKPGADGELVFAAPVALEAGSELRMFYGDRAATASLVHNGFVADGGGDPDAPFVLDDRALLAGGDAAALRGLLAASAGAVRMVSSGGTHVCDGLAVWLRACAASTSGGDVKGASRAVVVDAVAQKQHGGPAGAVALADLAADERACLRRALDDAVNALHPSVVRVLRQGGGAEGAGGDVAVSVARLLRERGGAGLLLARDRLAAR